MSNVERISKYRAWCELVQDAPEHWKLECTVTWKRYWAVNLFKRSHRGMLLFWDGLEVWDFDEH